MVIAILKNFFKKCLKLIVDVILNIVMVNLSLRNDSDRLLYLRRLLWMVLWL